MRRSNSNDSTTSSGSSGSSSNSSSGSSPSASSNASSYHPSGSSTSRTLLFSQSTNISLPFRLLGNIFSDASTRNRNDNLGGTERSTVSGLATLFNSFMYETQRIQQRHDTNMNHVNGGNNVDDIDDVGGLDDANNGDNVNDVKDMDDSYDPLGVTSSMTDEFNIDIDEAESESPPFDFLPNVMSTLATFSFIDAMLSLRRTMSEEEMLEAQTNSLINYEHKFDADVKLDVPTVVNNRLVNCGICLESIALNETIPSIGCVHTYHTHCLETWVQHKASCPVCRKDINITR